MTSERSFRWSSLEAAGRSEEGFYREVSWDLCGVQSSSWDFDGMGFIIREQEGLSLLGRWRGTFGISGGGGAEVSRISLEFTGGEINYYGKE